MRVLIADDVADTGKTLELVRNPDQGPGRYANDAITESHLLE
jgi:hypoxanthine phosphoribosyltransferase